MNTRTLPVDRVTTRREYAPSQRERMSPEAFRAALERAKEVAERLRRQYAVSGRDAGQGQA